MSSVVFDLSFLAKQLVGDKKFSREEAGMFALQAASDLYRQTFAACNVELDADDDAKFYATMVTVILGGEAAEVRLWRDLLDPETCHSFNNEVPAVIWDELKAQAKKYLDTGSVTNPKVIKHLQDLCEGKIEVPVYTKDWRQWISLNAAILLEDDYIGMLAEALQVDKLSPATQNFLKTVKKV